MWARLFLCGIRLPVAIICMYKIWLAKHVSTPETHFTNTRLIKIAVIITNHIHWRMGHDWVKQLVFTLLLVHEAWFHVPSIKYNTYTAVLRPRGDLFLLRIDTLLWPERDTTPLVPILFWQMGYGWVVNTLATAVGSDFVILSDPNPTTPHSHPASKMASI